MALAVNVVPRRKQKMPKCCVRRGRWGELVTASSLLNPKLRYPTFGEVSGRDGLELGSGQVVMRLQPANIVERPFNQSDDFLFIMKF